MKHKEKCIIRKGFFPETAEGINEDFVFASIDVDLYAPMYKGLHFFYDRLKSGGFIMIHDYNNTGFNGVKAAVRQFSEEKKAPYFPLCDVCGSAIIMKS